MTLSDSTGTAACSGPHVRQPTAPEARPLAQNSACWALEEGPRRLGAEDSALVLAESRDFFSFLRFDNPGAVPVACRAVLSVSGSVGDGWYSPLPRLYYRMCIN